MPYSICPIRTEADRSKWQSHIMQTWSAIPEQDIRLSMDGCDFVVNDAPCTCLAILQIITNAKCVSAQLDVLQLHADDDHEQTLLDTICSFAEMQHYSCIYLSPLTKHMRSLCMKRGFEHLYGAKDLNECLIKEYVSAN